MPMPCWRRWGTYAGSSIASTRSPAFRTEGNPGRHELGERVDLLVPDGMDARGQKIGAVLLYRSGDLFAPKAHHRLARHSRESLWIDASRNLGYQLVGDVERRLSVGP